MEQKHPCDDVLADAAPFLGCAVKRLLSTGYFRVGERRDLHQELVLAVLARWPKFNPKRATRTAFLIVVIRSRASKLLRQRIAYVKNYKPVPLEVCGTVDLDHQWHDDGLLLDRALDVRKLLETLPPDLRRIAELLLIEPTANVARLAGITRHKLRSCLHQIARYFRSLKKSNAVENGSTACRSPG